ncbi:MAG TPA: formate acetyltransferase 3, partial [Erysipelotrichaceae bacterium]|nr:formate acetyltransferase 3 [Erysipelotrichaceae bacterium]
MENKEHFGQLTDRMQAFREEVLDERPYIDEERAMIVTKVYQENEDKP